MEIPDQKKIDVLSAQLQERYSSLHKMRERSMQFVLWILGFGFGLAWLSINEVVFTRSQQWAVTVLLVVTALVAFGFVFAIERGFKANRETAIRIETALGLFEADGYGTEEAILPPRFSNFKTGLTGHFTTLYVLVVVVVLLLLVFTWTNPCTSVSGDDGASITNNGVSNSAIQ